ncbi:MAG: YfbM family protein [Hyphomicrobium sp.]|nr:YfbM family protein [Hyphomicrobium sp.]
MSDLRDPAHVEAFIAAVNWRTIPDDEWINLDKSWHAIHFLMTGDGVSTTLPAGTLFAGKVVSDDLGCGPARLLAPQEVAAFARLLNDKPDNFVERELDFDALQNSEIYPNIWDRRDPADLQYISWHFSRLTKFFDDAARSGDHVVLALL